MDSPKGKAKKPRVSGNLTGAKAIEHATTVLLAFANATRPLCVTEIAASIGLHKSTVSRQLAALARVDFVKREPGTGRYVLGLGLLPLAALANHQVNATARAQVEMLA